MKHNLKIAATSFLLLACLLLLPRASDAQISGGHEKFKKLAEMYAGKNYQNCAYKAENFTMNEKYKRDPEPYGYIAMCYIKIYEDTVLAKEYPDALKEAFSHAYKFYKKSKYTTKKDLREVDLYKANMSFINRLKEIGTQIAYDYVEEGRYSKAASAYGKVTKFVPHDYNLLFMRGVCTVLNNNSVTGKIKVDTAMKHIPVDYAQPDYKPDNITEPHLVSAFILFSDFLNATELQDSAKSIISMAKSIMPDNRDIKIQYFKVNELELPEEEKAYLEKRGGAIIRYKAKTR